MFKLTEGSIFGLISGCLTAIGLVLSNISAKTNTKIIIMILISLAVSDSLSDALGIYYSSYKDDNDYKKSLKEALNAFTGKSLIPLLMALIFFIFNNNIQATITILTAILILFLYINSNVFSNNKQAQLGNIIFFVIIIIINYYIGSKFN